MLTADQILASAQRTFDTEITALSELKDQLDQSLVQAVQWMLACRGRIVVTGIGKSGHIGRKIAATLASTGTPAFFMHAAEALHGDLGMITQDDIVLALSYSGQAHELTTILGLVKRIGSRFIAITGHPNSELAQHADLHLNVHVDHEACPLNLAPTASTTATLVIGDALAVACLEARGFSQEDFARSHPGGALGRQLLTLAQDIMRAGPALPVVQADTLVPDALATMSAKGMGMTIVVDDDYKPIGIFTDGDLRRLISRQGDIRYTTVTQGMTRDPRSIAPQTLAIEAARLMDTQRINQILIVDTLGKLLGALHMHDLLAAKVI
ncbi:MAG TPA: KpsF/GutQ family sugar-phosphate isomerase [Candidatus Paenalcaligenes intestinipullorum]|uniref:KpsF/GutQ family sugar-phosphate isomerase n=1 Tax=Candidatus Paenalcaligenes intestinipullorum TaxID=2838718 RepID=A0A9D2RHB7_9BURK|nr:KpsF/GutQ family sugar-phosphate isomerase [Candidatus Paenalcaligenes intestinipullorum]